ncbi:MAG: tRNA (N6-threonylcarbamoyladenosine(37)-N6)-methyltransferase TrmO [Syntrophomonadaceae bacterium]|nr:tRNA (N6-threonylcarbamoyladenosine(37)-N6)-methyltransferase TrmO [Syntrophomonadaceae bacterium]
MTVEQPILLNPIGIVKTGKENPREVPVSGRQLAEVEIFPPYRQGLLRIEANSHLWLLLWFHKADRHVLSTVPHRMNPNLPEYGVFGLRAPNRPNPIGLTLVELDSVEEGVLRVIGLDAIKGTPVLDIKPYFEHDIVFSPTTPHISAVDYRVRWSMFLKQALVHHQEPCTDLYLGVRMAITAEQIMGHLNTPELKVSVIGTLCLADTLQGLSRARLASPARFTFQENRDLSCSVWENHQYRLSLTANKGFSAEELESLADSQLFVINISSVSNKKGGTGNA